MSDRRTWGVGEHGRDTIRKPKTSSAHGWSAPDTSTRHRYATPAREKNASRAILTYAGFAPGAEFTRQPRAATERSAPAGDSAHLAVRFRTRSIEPAACIGAEPRFARPSQNGISVAGTSTPAGRDRSTPSRSIPRTLPDTPARYGRQRHLDRRRSILRLPAAA